MQFSGATNKNRTNPTLKTRTFSGDPPNQLVVAHAIGKDYIEYFTDKIHFVVCLFVTCTSMAGYNMTAMSPRLLQQFLKEIFQ